MSVRDQGTVRVFTPGTVLTTGRLSLRPFEASDAGDVYDAVRGDAEIARWMAWAEGYTPESAREFCERLAHDRPGEQITFAIVPDEDGRLAGAIGLTATGGPGNVPTVEVGYWLAARCRGRGYVTEAVRAVCSYAFSGGMERVVLQAAAGNAASQAVARRCGFTREGLLRRAGLVPGGVADMVLFGLLPGELT
ncbi:GNAT family N-acetyltransferase [Bailinhaonella thermotolerans]|uniref:N-acetyltransferase n=1 Tax=Bailinhaonella thermotolerans TaxID=1070861 RepID=A0A3A4AB83_9ACTN|nr:GNAT family protein [Bailinhaonella thermotolerans]RJL22793.1 N-acetyltransferase [Bailinhaonella thermotolerans]